MGLLGFGILSKLIGGGPDEDAFLRPESQSPRRLLVKADRRALDFERLRLQNQFGFEQTIAGNEPFTKEPETLLETRRRRQQIGRGNKR